MLLKDRVAVIAGGGGSLGAAYAAHFLAEGARVVIAEQIEERGRAAEAQLAALGEVVFIATDIGDEHSLQACVDRTLARFGSLDILVNSAAIADKQWGNRDFAYTRALFETNLLYQFLAIQAVAPAMARGRWGRILNIGSEAMFLPSGRAATPGPPPAPEDEFPGIFPDDFAWTAGIYGWAKNGLIHLTKMMARELGPWGITVNLASPGPTATASYLRKLGEEDLRQQAWAVPTRRITLPRDQAEAAVFLCSDRAGAITGQVLCVDGGMNFPV